MVAPSMVFKNRTTDDPGFAGLYTDSIRGDDGGSEVRNAEMDKSHFMVAAALEADLYGMSYRQIMSRDMYRFYGSTWGELDAGTIDAPMLVFNGELDTSCAPNLLPYFVKLYPQAKTTLWEG